MFTYRVERIWRWHDPASEFPLWPEPEGAGEVNFANSMAKLLLPPALLWLCGEVSMSLVGNSDRDLLVLVAFFFSMRTSCLYSRCQLAASSWSSSLSFRYCPSNLSSSFWRCWLSATEYLVRWFSRVSKIRWSNWKDYYRSEKTKWKITDESKKLNSRGKMSLSCNYLRKLCLLLTSCIPRNVIDESLQVPFVFAGSSVHSNQWWSFSFCPLHGAVRRVCSRFSPSLTTACPPSLK